MGAAKQAQIEEMESREVIGRCDMCQCDLYEDDVYSDRCIPCDEKMEED